MCAADLGFKLRQILPAMFGEPCAAQTRNCLRWCPAVIVTAYPTAETMTLGRDCGGALHCTVDAVSGFSTQAGLSRVIMRGEEEGLLGSLGMLGQLTEDDLSRRMRSGSAGPTLRELLTGIGVDPAAVSSGNIASILQNSRFY